MSVVTVLLMVLAAFAAVPGTAANEKEERYIVMFKDKADEDLIKSNNGKVVKKLGYSPAIVIKMKASDVKNLKKSDKVEAVEIDYKASALGKVTPQAKGGKRGPPDNGDEEPPVEDSEVTPWGIAKINADNVHFLSITGSAVKVGVLDTGVDVDHPDLVGNIKGGINIINTRKSYNDDHGHGTHTAGTIAAKDNTIGVIGVAPNAHIYAIKVLNKRGSGFYSDITEGIRWAISNEMAVLSMSIGGYSYSSFLEDAIDDAFGAGIVLVAAAGNNGDSVTYPAKFSNVIAVAATTESNDVASFSNPGNEVEVAAPGVGVESTYLGGRYATGDGTSMACPHVAGTAALILESFSDLSPSQVRKRLTETATATEDPTKDGNGLIDALGAYSYSETET